MFAKNVPLIWMIAINVKAILNVKVVKTLSMLIK